MKNEGGPTVRVKNEEYRKGEYVEEGVPHAVMGA
jgi:hypothetical protein